jgi:Xaa-Pro dipeptidase
LLAHSKRVVEFKSIYKKCLNHGLNVVTIGSFASYPWHNFPELTHQLHELAKANGVTITGTGNQDFFMVNLPVLMSGVCHRLDRIARAMALAEGEVPGFGPFIRSTPTMHQEHVTWGNHRLRHGDMLFVELSGCRRRYHAPMGRLFFIGDMPEGTERIARICAEAFDAAVSAIKPGVTANDAYQAWQTVVDQAGLSSYQRHHCGYMIGMGFPPSWVGGSRVLGLRRDSSQILQAGMSFHLLSWLMGTGIGDYLITDTVILNSTGGQGLRRFPVAPKVL